MHAASANPQPLALAFFHQEKRDVCVLEFFVRLHGLQIGAAENKSVGAQWIRKRIAGQGPAFDLPLTRDKFRIHAHQPGNRIADMQQMCEVGAE